MANRTRAERRHLRAHLIIRRDKEYARLGVAFPKETDWHFKSARVRARTATLCSCFVCCNVRRKYGNSIKARTKAEVVSMLDLKEGLWEENLWTYPVRGLADCQ